MAKIGTFISLAYGQVNKGIYVWGANGELLKDITPEWIKKKENSTANANKAIEMYNKRKGISGARAVDCSGLVCWALRECGAKPSGFDKTAEGLRQMCTKVTKSELKDGDLCFKVSDGKAHHVGIYYKGKIIEAKGRAYGVVSSNVTASWNAFGRLKVFASETTAKPTQPTYYFTLSRTLYWNTKRYGKKATNMHGDDVRLVQTRLINLGFSCGSWGADGSYGEDTYTAVRNFQKSTKKLTVDGIVGKNTCTALGGKWNG